MDLQWLRRRQGLQWLRRRNGLQWLRQIDNPLFPILHDLLWLMFPGGTPPYNLHDVCIKKHVFPVGRTCTITEDHSK